MAITKSISSRSNVKQLTNTDLPFTPSQAVSASYGPVTSTASQLVINLSFAVSLTNISNFFLVINGRTLALGSTNDYTFTSIQPSNTSSQITMNSALPAGLNIQAFYLGLIVPNFSLGSLQAQANAATAAIPKNYLINGGFDYWQRGTSTTVANGSSVYLADRFYAKNSLGTNGVLTYSQLAGVNSGSKFGASVQITTAPTAAQTNGTELYQVIENLNSIELLNQSISASILIRALGNVTSVGIQFGYATSETKTTLFFGSEQTVAVNSSTFSVGQLLNQAVGTLPTSAGVVSIRIRILNVASGNTYDLNNGFVVEQAILNVGTVAATFSRSGRNTQEELAMCQRYYNRSTETFGWQGNVTSGAGYYINLRYGTTMRVSPSFVPTYTGGSNFAGSLTSQQPGLNGIAVQGTANGTASAAFFQFTWTADADI